MSNRHTQTHFKKSIKQFWFGLTGIDKKNIVKTLLRSEGDRNLSNDFHYTGSMSIFLKYPFKQLLRQQRCLVLVDAFIMSDNGKAYLVYLRNKNRPFAFAGIWNKTILDGKIFFLSVFFPLLQIAWSEKLDLKECRLSLTQLKKDDG